MIHLHHFAPRVGYVELVSPGRLKSGEELYLLLYRATVEEGGGHIGVWDGTDYAEGLDAASGWVEEGIRFVDSVARVWAARYGEFLPRVEGGARD